MSKGETPTGAKKFNREVADLDSKRSLQWRCWFPDEKTIILDDVIIKRLGSGAAGLRHNKFFSGVSAPRYQRSLLKFHH